MWLNQRVSENFHKEYAIEEKILDVRGENILEIFKSKQFGQIAIINETQVLLERFVFMQSELIAHIGACCLPLDNKNTEQTKTGSFIESKLNSALVLGGFNLEIAYELLRHTMRVDFIQSDTKLLDSLISFLPHFQDVRTSPDFHLYEKAIELKKNAYQLIIHQSVPSIYEIEGMDRILEPYGVLIATLPHPYLQIEQCSDALLAFGKVFEIVMPFFIPFSPFDHQTFVFASHTTHPLANLWLQKCDMIEGLQFYNADMHQAAFTLPTYLAKTLKGIIKN